MELVTAPFTPEQVESINGFQRSRFYHPFTCNSWHPLQSEKDLTLYATTEGMHCKHCGYRQGWVHDFMANWKWKEALTPIIQAISQRSVYKSVSNPSANDLTRDGSADYSA